MNQSEPFIFIRGMEIRSSDCFIPLCVMHYALCEKLCSRPCTRLVFLEEIESDHSWTFSYQFISLPPLNGGTNRSGSLYCVIIVL